MAVSASLKANESALGPRLPLRLGRFTLCEELGAGGMATVYLARMELAGGIDRLVALKTIHTHLAKEANFVDMFLDEARIASHVSHPNVCSTYDFGEVDNVYYLAMEYLLGEPLFDVINRMVERFDEAREVLPFLAARIIADAAEGLHAAHNAHGPGGEVLSIVHRDVSPQNLFVTYDGSVKVVDFGCAKAAERVAHTSTGVMKGKVAYAAPEQLKAEGVDHRADVFALGVCLWECLTLSPLFSKDAAVKTAMAVLQDDIELASDGRDWVPERVAQIADRALNRNREERYPSARAMGRDLREFIADSGFTLESAELAEWMEFLFEDRHEARILQTTRVREMDISGASTGPLYEVSADDIELLASEPAAFEAIIEPDDPEPLSHEDVMLVGGDAEPDDNEGALVVPTRRRWPWVLLLLLLFGVGLFYLHQNYEMAPWAAELMGLETPASTGPAAGTVDDTPPSLGPAEDMDATEESRDESEEPGATDESSEEDGAADVSEPSTDASAATEDSDATEEDGSGSEPSTPSGRRGRRREPASRTVTTVVSGGGGSWANSNPSPQPSPSPTPEPAASNTAASNTGEVTIRATHGWAAVFRGSRNLGRTPVRVDLPPGRHMLRILPFGEEPSENLSVQVHAGIDQTISLNIAEP
ncbi:MAG: protein kinase [Sandaracinaceae bacterium]